MVVGGQLGRAEVGSEETFKCLGKRPRICNERTPPVRVVRYRRTFGWNMPDNDRSLKFGVEVRRLSGTESSQPVSSIEFGSGTGPGSE